MNDVNKHCDDNLGGLYLFKFIPVDEIASIAEPIDSKVCEPIELATNGRWYDFYCTEGTMKYSEDIQPSPQGDYYKAELSGFTPKDRTDITDQFEKMKNKKFIIDYTDNNNHRKLIGTKEYPLTFANSLDTGEGAAKRNGHSIKFFGELLVKSPTYFI